MKKYKIFDVIGPMMIGPSSSHTAGAAKIGKVARDIYGKDFNSVTFYLHGSFQTTLEGHGSDRALVGGVLGFKPDDDRLVDSLNIANEKRINFSFINKDLGYVHPNTIQVVFHGEEDFYVTASSIGGGKIRIIDINGITVDMLGEYPSVVINYKDRLGIIADIANVMKENSLSIASFKVTRKGENASLVTELDDKFNEDVLNRIREIDNIKHVIGIDSF